MQVGSGGIAGQEQCSSSPVIFTHYGDVDYLARALRVARLTNPGKRMVLIGDESNRQTALGAGWEHVDIDACVSDLRSEFLSRFQPIKGPQHVSPKGSRVWIQYVLERWFVVTAFAKAQGLSSFWHFDSDVMIVTPLDPFENILRQEGFDYTKQCSGACLNGFVTTAAAEKFCRYAADFFTDTARLAAYQQRFDEERPTFALTEMEIFWHFDQQGTCRSCHLESHFPGWWFDDVLCEDDGCDTVRMGMFGPVIKDVRFDGTYFTLSCRGRRVNLAAMNCSWLPISVFDWIMARVENAAAGRTLSRKDRLGALWPGLVFEYRGLRSQIKKMLAALKGR